MPSLIWYLARARSMEPGELGFRVLQAVHRKLAGRWNRVETSGGATRDWLPPILEVVPVAPAGVDASVSRAEDILAGMFDILGSKQNLGEIPDWHRDLETGNCWPMHHGFDIDYRDSRIGDVKRVWELNRHQFLPTLARAYRHRQDERYRKHLNRLLRNWIAKNPLYRGINWSSPYEAALRLISWCEVMRLAGANLDTGCRSEMLASAGAHLAFIEGNLSLYSSANNHLLGELAAVVAACDIFPVARANDRLRTAWKHFLKEFLRQVHPDGVSAEQALCYHGYVLDLALLVLAVARRQGLDVPDEFTKRLVRMGGFLIGCHSDGGAALGFGDEDSGEAYNATDWPIPALQRAAWTVVLMAGASCRLPTYPGREDQALMLFGTSSPIVEDHLPGLRTEGVFPDGGRGLWRSDDILWAFDFGPLGLPPLAAHGHADSLSLNILVGRDRLLIDPGTYTYNGDPSWRRYFKGTSAHNTVLVDGTDQSRMMASFIWGDHAATRLVAHQETKEWIFVEAEHDGYRSMGVIHRRSVLFLRQGIWLVRDVLRGNGIHTFSQIFHTGLGVRISDQVVEFEGDRRYMMRAMSGQSLEVRIGARDPEQGWNSHRLGHLEPAPAILCTLTAAAPTVLRVALGIGLPELTALEETFEMMEQHLCAA